MSLCSGNYRLFWLSRYTKITQQAQSSALQKLIELFKKRSKSALFQSFLQKTIVIFDECAKTNIKIKVAKQK